MSSEFPLDLSSSAMSKKQPQATKRGLTLDLQNGPAKRTRLSIPGAAAPGPSGSNPPILTTPDVQMLKLSSPELAKFLNANNGLATPTPSGYLFPKTVTEEQELYAKGFEVALEKMRETGTQAPGGATAINTIERATSAHRAMTAAAVAANDRLSRPNSGASGSLASDEADVSIKEEAESDSDVSETTQTAGAKLSPIDMASQEKIKLERKRQRNRVAASKCRKRKLERISQLDDKVQKLKGENAELATIMKKLKESVCNLKQEVMQHMQNGCQIMGPDISAI